MIDRPKFSLYAIVLSITPAVQLDPPSRFPEAKRRIFCVSCITSMGAVDAFNRSLRMGAWPLNAEPEVRDLREGHVVYFRTHTGAWAVPDPLLSEHDDITGH